MVEPVDSTTKEKNNYILNHSDKPQDHKIAYCIIFAIATVAVTLSISVTVCVLKLSDERVLRMNHHKEIKQLDFEEMKINTRQKNILNNYFEENPLSKIKHDKEMAEMEKKKLEMTFNHELALAEKEMRRQIYLKSMTRGRKETIRTETDWFGRPVRIQVTEELADFNDAAYRHLSKKCTSQEDQNQRDNDNYP